MLRVCGISAALQFNVNFFLSCLANVPVYTMNELGGFLSDFERLLLFPSLSSIR